MVAAVLHLDEGAGAAGQAVDQMRGRLLTAMMSLTIAFGASSILKAARVCIPSRCAELLRIAEHAIGLGHGNECLRLGLRGAAGDDDLRLRTLAA